MADVAIALFPEGAKFATTTAEPQRIFSTGASVTSGLAFDASTNENAFWDFPVPRIGASTTTINLDIFWYAKGAATSGVVKWRAWILPITPNTDTDDMEGLGTGTEIGQTDTHLGTTAQRLHMVTLAHTSIGGAADGDQVRLRLGRHAADASDTLTVDAVITMVVVRYAE